MGRFVWNASLLPCADILLAYAIFVMQNYLTQVWGFSFTHVAGILNLWSGISMALPLLILFCRSAWLTDRRVLVISSIASSVGIGLVTLSVPSVLSNRCKQLDSKCVGRSQRALFYTGMALIAVGIAGNQVSLKPFVDDQTKKLENGNGQTEQAENGNAQTDRAENGNGQTEVTRQAGNADDECDPTEGLNYCLKGIVKVAGGASGLPYLNPWENQAGIRSTCLVVGTALGANGLAYVKSWKLRFGIPAICTTFAAILFFTGFFPCCKYKEDGARDGARKSLTEICRVFVTCFRNICKDRPRDGQYHRNAGDTVQSFQTTRCLGCLEKAAIKKQGGSPEQVSMQQVEEAKIAVRMVPMWLTFLICGIVSSIGNTYFVEQANNLDRHIGKWKAPVTVLFLLQAYFKQGFGLEAMLYEMMERIGVPFGIVNAMIYSILCCITAAKIEERRLNVVRKHDLLDKPDADIPMSMYWLLFQFYLLAGLDAHFEKAVAGFYKYEAPTGMTQYFMHMSKGVYGLGYMLGVVSVYVVGKVSEKGGKQPNWFQKTLNRSRLDRYYWVLSAMSAVNLVVYIVVACTYKSKEGDENQESRNEEGQDVGTGGV